jgi:hypothetical protein
MSEESKKSKSKPGMDIKPKTGAQSKSGGSIKPKKE